MSDEDNKFYRGHERRYLKKGVKLAPRIIPIPAGCWMCGLTDVKMSKEHVYPVWLLKHFNLMSQKIQPTHLDVAGNVIDTREQSFANMVCGKICKSNCNEGWMRRLENSFKEIYLNDWNLKSKSNRILMARWLAKTATTLNISQSRRVQVPERARHGLADEEILPDGWRIYVFKLKDIKQPVNWIQGGIGTAIAKKHVSSGQSAEIMNRVFTCGLKVGELGAVIYWTPPEIKHAEPAFPMMSLWPKFSGNLHEHDWYEYGTTISGFDLMNNSQKWKKHIKRIREQAPKWMKEAYKQ